MNKRNKIGREVIINDYFEEGCNEYGIITEVKESHYIVETYGGHHYHAFFKSEGTNWEIMPEYFEEEEMTAEEFKNWVENVLQESEDRKLKRWIKEEIKVPKVLTKEDYNKLLNRAIDLHDYKEAYRIAKKMEVI